ncbi:hypothetical protein [Paraburkholderia sp. J76]|uniref:hypothetical protein n=1 Tax=Paraburkholderia sp. J76 TaxID=2805439 RepID=UPI002ABE8293|nr:hypothetical protein [Paraburkholderia sp. J76]
MPNWKDLGELDIGKILPPGYTQAVLSRNDIPRLCAAIERWHPDIEVGIGSKFLQPRFYEQQVGLKGEPERDTIAYCGTYAGEIVSILVLTRNTQSLTLFGDFGAVAPEHRRAGVAAFGGFMLDAQAKAMGFVMSHTLATMKTPAMQRMLERAGFLPIGIVPASDREKAADGAVFSVSEVLYAKVHREHASILPVAQENMTDAVARLWKAMLPAPIN